MDLLLDTHIWLWSELDPSRLPAPAATALRAPANRLWLSPVSVWEMSRLVLRGRISLTRGPAPSNDLPWLEWLRMCRQRTPYNDAALGLDVVEAAHAIELDHRDPMDWLLAATARYYRLTLVTADERLLSGHGFARLRLA